jgi:hypothetical protein
MREVLEDRAIFHDVRDLDGLIRAAEEVTRPAPQPPSWTWADAAEATWQVYDEAAHAARRWRGARRRGVPVPGAVAPDGSVRGGASDVATSE